MLTPRQRSQLRALAHPRQAVVTTGQRGLTPAVLAEIEQALEHHELVKVRLNAPDRTAREAMAATICEETGSERVQRIGHVLVIYRKAGKPKIELVDP